jgi:hypothetical protein
MWIYLIAFIYIYRWFNLWHAPRKNVMVNLLPCIIVGWRWKNVLARSLCVSQKNGGNDSTQGNKCGNNSLVIYLDEVAPSVGTCEFWPRVRTNNSKYMQSVRLWHSHGKRHWRVLIVAKECKVRRVEKSREGGTHQELPWSTKEEAWNWWVQCPVKIQWSRSQAWGSRARATQQ